MKHKKRYLICYVYDFYAKPKYGYHVWDWKKRKFISKMYRYKISAIIFKIKTLRNDYKWKK